MRIQAVAPHLFRANSTCWNGFRKGRVSIRFKLNLLLTGRLAPRHQTATITWRKDSEHLPLRNGFEDRGGPSWLTPVGPSAPIFVSGTRPCRAVPSCPVTPPANGAGPPAVVTLFVASAFLLVAFVLVELRNAYPTMRLSLFRVWERGPPASS